MKPGDRVTLKPGVVHTCPAGRRNHRTARIHMLLQGIPGGEYTDRDLRGCRYWNTEDLQLVRAGGGE